MKKLLCLIGVLSIVGSGASAVSACGSNSNSNQTNQQQVDAIEKKINIKAFVVPKGTNPDVTSAAGKTAINKALNSANSSLTVDDLNTLSYTGSNLVAGVATSITAAITVGTGQQTATGTVELQVTLVQTNQQKADAIKNKITITAINVPEGTNPNVTSNAAKTAIDIALQLRNPTLDSDDLKTITYTGSNLETSKINAVRATITVGAGAAVVTDTVDLSVTLTLKSLNTWGDEQKQELIKTIQTELHSNIVFSNSRTTKWKNNFNDIISASLLNTLRIITGLNNLASKDYNIAIIDQTGNPPSANATLSSITSLTVTINGTVMLQGSLTLTFTPNWTKWNKIPSLNHLLGVYSFIQAKNGTIYAGTFNNLWESKDNGKSWTKASGYLGNNGIIYSIFQTKNGTIYAGAGGLGLYQTIDNGATWTKVSAIPITGSAGVDAIYQTANGTIYAGTNGNGLYQSTDNGATWTKVSGLPSNTNFILSIYQNKNGIIYAGMYANGLYQSIDNGATWTKVSLLNNTSVHAIDQAKNGTIYVGTTDGLYENKN